MRLLQKKKKKKKKKNFHAKITSLKLLYPLTSNTNNLNTVFFVCVFFFFKIVKHI